MSPNSANEEAVGDRFYRIAYDGTAYHGFQRQPDVPTVAGAIRTALTALDVSTERWAAAGRTDAGVSAIGQTVRIRGPEWLTPRALNSRLPDDIWCWAWATVDSDQHPRYDARERTYWYVCDAPAIDLDRVHEVCDRLVGTHDLQNLSAASEHTKRTISEIDVIQDGAILEVSITAPNFIHEQVRRIVTLLTEVGTGKLSVEFVDRLLDPTFDPGGAAGIGPASPAPLVLLNVVYPEVSFTVDSVARTQATQWFADRSTELYLSHRTNERISSSLTAASTDQHR